MCMYVSEICADGIIVTFPWWLKNVKSRSKIALFSNERHSEIWFPKKKTIRFSEVDYLNYTKRPNFARGYYIFPKTKGNKNKPWTHSTPLKGTQSNFIPWLHVFEHRGENCLLPFRELGLNSVHFEVWNNSINAPVLPVHLALLFNAHVMLPRINSTWIRLSIMVCIYYIV